MLLILLKKISYPEVHEEIYFIIINIKENWKCKLLKMIKCEINKIVRQYYKYLRKYQIYKYI